MNQLQPMNGYIALRLVEEQEQTYGNIVIPDLGKERPELGEVVAISSTYNYNSDKWISSQLQVGDKVLIPKLGSVRITLEGEEYFICKEQDIYSKLTSKDPIIDLYKETESEMKKGDIGPDHYFIANLQEDTTEKIF